MGIDASQSHLNEADVGASYERLLQRWRWRDFANIALGGWLIAAPFALRYTQVTPALAWSDVISGVVVVILGILTLWPRFDLLRWGIATVGVWLMFAPLIFWTRSSAAYNGDTFVGALLVTLSVVLPVMPGRTHHATTRLPGPDVPPGWSYNPSDFLQRMPIIVTALIAFFASRYLTAYQLGHLSWPWDPFFGDGTKRVLESDVSKAWPISDAGLGAVSYLIEALLGLMGGRSRWRTMPWMVALFGILVVPLGIVSMTLIILQPIAVGAWCGLCLFTAALMLIMISPALDEVIASCQFLVAARREGQSLWRTFWLGGTLSSASASDSAPAAESASYFRQIIRAMDLDNVPWNLLVTAALGIWVTFVPTLLKATGAAANSDYLVGPLIVAASVIAFSEIARPARLLNLLLGAWLIFAPWLLDGASWTSQWSDMLVGVAVIGLSLRRGTVTGRFGGWNRVLV